MKSYVFKAKPYSEIVMKKVLRLCCFAFCVLMVTGVLVQSVYAHKVNIFAYAEDGRIHAEGYFVDGSKCMNSQVDVIDNKSGEKLLEGRTDDHGQFLFDIPRVTSLQLILHAGTGHQNEYILSEEEVREAMPETEEKQKTEQKVKQTKKTGDGKQETVSESKPEKSKKSASIHHGMNTMNTTSHDMDEAIERIIDRKLQPVMKILMTLQEKSERPGMTEILGGIGYIIGILGVIAYFKGRSKKP